MKLDRRLTNGLAWAGALLVIGIPAADYLTGTFANSATPSIAVVDAEAEAPTPAAKPAEATPVVATTSPATPAAPKPQAVASTDPVGGFLQGGRPLPSYITGGDAAPAAPTRPAVSTPSPSATPAAQPSSQNATPSTSTAARPPITTTTPTEQVAALPAKVAPTPAPLSMRPRPVSVPLASSQPLIIDQPAPQVSLPPAQPVPQEFITSEDLQSWESGPLSEFLAKRNQRSSATYTVQQTTPPPRPAINDGGFWLDEMPQGDRPVRRYDDDVIYLPY